MSAAASTGSAPADRLPERSPFLIVLVSWLVPGAGHFLLSRRGRAAILFATILLTFLVGIAMNGPFFSPSSNGDMLSRLIQYGGFIGDLASGGLYFVAWLLGYGPPDQAGHVPDYGSKFLVAAGLMNILAMVDAYEIATKKKD
jgi:hypothetical protein